MIQKTLLIWFKRVLNLEKHDQMHEWQRNQKDESGSLNLFANNECYMIFFFHLWRLIWMLDKLIVA